MPFENLATPQMLSSCKPFYEALGALVSVLAIKSRESFLRESLFNALMRMVPRRAVWFGYTENLAT